MRVNRFSRFGRLIKHITTVTPAGQLRTLSSERNQPELWNDSGVPGGTFNITSGFLIFFFPFSLLFCSFMPVRLFLLSFVTHWTTELAVFCCLKCNLSKITFKVFIFRPSLLLLCTTEESSISLCSR